MNAPPKTFYVETVSATAVDLGCSYRLTIDTAGDGILFVRSGMVALQSDKRESLVPAGKYCITKKDFGPGTPFREDITEEMKTALMQFDFGECASSCIRTIVKNAQKSDAVTLINILPRVNDEYKHIVYEKVAFFCPPPKRIPHDSIPKLDKLEKLNEWIEVIIEDVHKNIEENMKDIDKQIRIHIDKDMEYKFDSDKWAKEWKEEMEKNKDKWKKFKYYYSDDDTIITFDDEEFKKDMEDMQKDLEEMNIEIERNNEEIKIEMKKLKEDLKKMNIEIQKELQEELKDIDKEVYKQLKDIHIEVKDSVDATDSTKHQNIIIKIKKDKDDVKDSTNQDVDK
jgi:thiol-disulfide isomerase/thioredoxin